MKIELRPIDEVMPASYNPRRPVEKRMNALKLSMAKCGFVTPVYVHGREILSGHRRTETARALGWESVPVVEVAESKAFDKMGLNLLFNRSTNDMEASQNGADIEDIVTEAILEAAMNLPDLDGESRYPCLGMVQRPISDLSPWSKEEFRRTQHSSATSRSLDNAGVRIPIIATPDGRIVNGVGRYRYAGEHNIDRWPIVTVSEDVAEIAKAFLNGISMDFEINDRYKRILRHNSFRRANATKTRLKMGYLWPIFTVVKGMKSSKDFDIRVAAHKATFTKVFGEVVLDFGCGLRNELDILRQNGIDADGFEPYPVPNGRVEPDLSYSREFNGEFLARVEEGKRWDSIVMSAVLNSVPFYEDRRKVLAIVSALCGRRTTLFANVLPSDSANRLHAKGKCVQGKTSQRILIFDFSYEPETNIGDLRKRPKVQKFHTEQSFHDLLSEFFESVEIHTPIGTLGAICRNPKPADKAFLEEAIRFEFDLPYPNGQTINLAERAVQAFKSAKLL